MYVINININEISICFTKSEYVQYLFLVSNSLFRMILNESVPTIINRVTPIRWEHEHERNDRLRKCLLYILYNTFWNTLLPPVHPRFGGNKTSGETSFTKEKTSLSEVDTAFRPVDFWIARIARGLTNHGRRRCTATKQGRFVLRNPAWSSELARRELPSRQPRVHS